ncbi:MAG: fructose-1,6-bisphosphatase [Lachnospiraceae bacterium]|nr:fructose-1,6-bisphosphatase [Lachnospiraceae bacterium]
MAESEMKYLKSLANQYPTIAKASTEIINLQAILNLPKGTEHFITDIHGEYEQFQHVIRNGSGSVKRKIEEEFGSTFSMKTKKSLATLIYYPEEKLALVKASEENINDWYNITIHRLIQITKKAATKYSRSKVRKALPTDFAYVIEELITGRGDMPDKEAYYNEIINSAIEIGRADNLIIAFCKVIQRLVIDRLHVLGDIYDRGPLPHKVMDMLMRYHDVDVQWGNHDILWMGAAAGQTECMCTLLRISAKYGNLDILEDGYGINLVPLVRFAMKTYKDDPCECFKISFRESEYNILDADLDRKMHKALAVIQFKLEGQLIKRRPEFNMEARNLLHKIDFKKGTVTVEGKKYKMLDMNFPTINPKDPYKLTPEEEKVVNRLQSAFLESEKLQRHIRFMFSKGSLYKICNSNLLFHGCIPLDKDGKFKKVNIYGKEYSGKKLLDVLEKYARMGYYSIKPKEKRDGLDIMYYLWTNANSPLFGKDKMTTFERYFIADKETHKEPKNPYYSWIEKKETAQMIFDEFSLNYETSHIVNGHIPIESKKGENPIKCDGKVLMIDGGFSKAYQPKTGIAGYTLIYNSYGMLLAAHEPFESMKTAVRNESDIYSDTMIVQKVVSRKRVADTDIGKELQEQVRDLKKLLKAYRDGKIPEKI